MARSLIGTRIRERRRAAGLSQTRLAESAGISASYLNLIEHNRRGIGGRTLNALAAALNVEPQQLSDSADLPLLNDLRTITAEASEIGVEHDRLEEFVGRFPGWAALTANLGGQVARQRQDLLSLSDRLAHDPFLSEALHLMLSNITAIQSTSAILAEGEAVPTDIQSRFLTNLASEAERLSKTATDLVSYFDTPQDEITSDEDPVDHFWRETAYHIPEIEAGEDPSYITARFESVTHRARAHRELTDYAHLSRIMPLEDFLRLAAKVQYDPVLLARSFNTGIDPVLRRFAHLPPRDDIPTFGFVEVDQAGGIRFRKPLPNLQVPHFSSACPLWPVYRALSQPMQPLRALLEFPTGETFYTLSHASPRAQSGFGLPATYEASMAFTEDMHALSSAAERNTLPRLGVGLHCAVCPRIDCNARRQDYLLG